MPRFFILPGCSAVANAFRTVQEKPAYSPLQAPGIHCVKTLFCSSLGQVESAIGSRRFWEQPSPDDLWDLERRYPSSSLLRWNHSEACSTEPPRGAHRDCAPVTHSTPLGSTPLSLPSLSRPRSLYQSFLEPSPRSSVFTKSLPLHTHRSWVLSASGIAWRIPRLVCPLACLLVVPRDGSSILLGALTLPSPSLVQPPLCCPLGLLWFMAAQLLPPPCWPGCSWAA